MKSCEACGLPDDVCAGLKLRVTFRSGKGRDRTGTVWVCGPFCGWLILAQATMGMDSSRWPLRLHQFIAANPQGLERSIVDQDRDKPMAKTRINSGDNEAEFPISELPYIKQVCHAQKGGRPRLANPSAATRRKRRQRAKGHVKVKG